MIFSQEGFISVANLYKLGCRTQSIDFVEKKMKFVEYLQLTENNLHETVSERIYSFTLCCVVKILPKAMHSYIQINTVTKENVNTFKFPSFLLLYAPPILLCSRALKCMPLQHS